MMNFCAEYTTTIEIYQVESLKLTTKDVDSKYQKITITILPKNLATLSTLHKNTQVTGLHYNFKQHTWNHFFSAKAICFT